MTDKRQRSVATKEAAAALSAKLRKEEERASAIVDHQAETQRISENTARLRALRLAMEAAEKAPPKKKRLRSKTPTP